MIMSERNEWILISLKMDKSGANACSGELTTLHDALQIVFIFNFT